MEFKNKSALGFYFSVVTTILSAVALCIYILNTGNSYYADLNLIIALLTGVSIVCTVGAIVIYRSKVTKIMADILMIAAPVCLAFAVAMFISARAYSMAIILGSDLEKGNAQAWNALMQSFWGMGVYVVAIITAIATAFMKQTKED